MYIFRLPLQKWAEGCNLNISHLEVRAHQRLFNDYLFLNINMMNKKKIPKEISGPSVSWNAFIHHVYVDYEKFVFKRNRPWTGFDNSVCSHFEATKKVSSGASNVMYRMVSAESVRYPVEKQNKYQARGKHSLYLQATEALYMTYKSTPSHYHVNRCHIQRKNSILKMRSESRAANSHWWQGKKG